MNELWKVQKGTLAGYTEDRDLIRRIKRSQKQWYVSAEYFKHGKLFALQYRIPMADRRMAERQFGVKIQAN